MARLRFTEVIDSYRNEDPRLCTALKVLYDTNPFFKAWADSLDTNNILLQLQEMASFVDLLISGTTLVRDTKIAGVLLAEMYFALQKYFYINFCVRAYLENLFLQRVRERLNVAGIADEQKVVYRVLDIFAKLGHKTLATEIAGRDADAWEFIDIPKEFQSIVDVLLPLYNLIVDIQNIGFSKIADPISRAMKPLLALWVERNGEQKGQLLGLWLNIRTRRHYLAPDWVLYSARNALINIRSGDILVLDDNVVRILLSALRGELLEPLYKSVEVLDAFIEEGILTSDANVVLSAIPRKKRILFELTLRCNLSCRYCFNRNFKRDFELMPKDYEEIIRKLPEGTEITLFGGEPFLYSGILDVLKAIEKYDRNFTVRCFTNGTLPERVADVLAQVQKPIYLLVSVDGYMDAHESVRGKGTYDLVKRTLRLVRERAPQHKIVIKTTVSKLNIHSIEQMLEDLSGLYDFVAFGELHLTGNAADKANERVSYDEWFSILEGLRERYPMWDPSEAELFNRCGFGLDLVYIRSDGYIGGCTEEDIYRHHIFRWFNYGGDLWDLLPVLTPNLDCISCPLWWACKGGCRARAYRMTGSWSGCDYDRKRYVERALDHILDRALNDSIRS